MPRAHPASNVMAAVNVVRAFIGYSLAFDVGTPFIGGFHSAFIHGVGGAPCEYSQHGESGYNLEDALSATFGGGGGGATLLGDSIDEDARKHRVPAHA